MDIKRCDRCSTRRKVAIVAGVFILMLAGVTGAGMLVFAPTAGAWPTSMLAQWTRSEDDSGTGSLGADDGGSAEGTLALDETAENAETEGESLFSRLVGLLKGDAPDMDAITLAGAASAAAASSEPTSTDAENEEGGQGEENGESDMVFQVTQGDVERAKAVGEEAVGFWRWLWNMLWGAMKSVAETVVSAVT